MTTLGCIERMSFPILSFSSDYNQSSPYVTSLNHSLHNDGCNLCKPAADQSFRPLCQWCLYWYSLWDWIDLIRVLGFDESSHTQLGLSVSTWSRIFLHCCLINFDRARNLIFIYYIVVSSSSWWLQNNSTVNKGSGSRRGAVGAFLSTGIDQIKWLETWDSDSAITTVHFQVKSKSPNNWHWPPTEYRVPSLASVAN